MNQNMNKLAQDLSKEFSRLHQLICSECYELIGFSAEKITGYIQCMKCRNIMNQGLDESL